MRLTLGKLVRKNVCGVRLGADRVAEVRHGEALIWPTLSDTISKCVLDVAEVEDTRDGAYLAHALGLLEEGKASIKVVCGGREYYVDAEHGRFDVAHWDGHGGLVFGDCGPLGEDLKVGDRVSLDLVVEEAEKSASYASAAENEGISEAWGCRWLPGTALVYSHYKGQKKRCSWAHGTVTGAESGLVYVAAPHHIHEGHKRETDVHTVYPADGFEPDYGDTRFLVEMEVGGSSGITACYLLFPAFRRTLTLHVASVTYHD